MYGILRLHCIRQYIGAEFYTMRLPKDKNGKTEAEFLRDYDVTCYFRPSVTVDAVLYRATDKGLRILFISRGGHPFIGMYAFPGGFVEKNESCETAVYRELAEETGIKGVTLRQLVTVSTPDRDPRWRNITVVYCGEVPTEPKANAGDDAATAEWLDVALDADGTLNVSKPSGERFECRMNIVRDAFGRIDLNATQITDRGTLAFDHAKVAAYLVDIVRNDIRGE